MFKPEPAAEPVAAATTNTAERNEPNSQPPATATAPEPDTPKSNGGDLAAFAFPVMERNNSKRDNSRLNYPGPNEPNAATRPPAQSATAARPAADPEAA